MWKERREVAPLVVKLTHWPWVSLVSRSLYLRCDELGYIGFGFGANAKDFQNEEPLKFNMFARTTALKLLYLKPSGVRHLINAAELFMILNFAINLDLDVSPLKDQIKR